MRSFCLNAPVRLSFQGGTGRVGIAGKKTSSSEVEDRSKQDVLLSLRRSFV